MKNLLFILLFLPTITQCGFLSDFMSRITTRYRIHQLHKLGEWAQTQVGIPKKLRCEIEIADINYPYYGPVPSCDFEDLKKKKISYPKAKLLSVQLGAEKDILVHESTHRKQDIETLAWIQTELMAALKTDPIKAAQQNLFKEKAFKEFVKKRWWNCISLASLEKGADHAFLQETNCYKCLDQATKCYRASLQERLSDAQKSHSDLKTIEDYYDYFIKEDGHLPPSTFAKKTQELKEQHIICSTHRHQKVFKLMLPLMATYGLE